MNKNHGASARVVRTRLVGGIGNQLFSYFAGLVLACRLKAQLEIDVTDIRKEGSLHQVSIETLLVSGRFVSRRRDFFSDLLFRFKVKLFRQLSAFNKTSYYVSPVVGYDPRLYEINRSVTIDGYFQSYKYFYAIKDEIPPIKLDSKSEWMRGMESSLLGVPFASIHVRRGDYAKLSDTYGLLGKEYYSKAIEILRGTYPELIFLIFSDDINQARSLLHDLVPESSIWVDPPKGNNSVESLVLMSLATANIIANSTFSWWGAALNSRQDLVIAPDKWFRGMVDPKLLIPPHWKLVESSWEF